ncbi:phosphonate ABC transporter ATP-binding protein [Oceanivirga miroungae]|uniref:ABC transporter domain-containing protein n=1 Tax=Oceanivirga miroungae TaxID=1130046 RepID=A0A6I8MEB2_9FUSO|nr:phosphonate ABC transporter ATP-binding protein [Oceanivirga miroungae]VWL85922.1 hypothetical protein OMES3154_01207 [Oceanivirga miroungae]
MIKFEKVDKVYKNGYKALTDINLEIKEGEFVAIIGRSGAGKSTLIRTINKMIDINSGSLLVEGVDVSKLTGKKLRKFRRNIGMIFQQFNLVNRMSVINNVLAGFVPDLNIFQSTLGLYPKKYKLKALEALQEVDILEQAYSRADQLSGGQKQRVALARTIAQDPKIILADEPTASLDPVTSRQVMEYLKKINKENNIAILLNIHEIDLGLEYAERCIGIKDGIVVYDGPSSEVNSEVLELIYGDAYNKGE